MQGKSWPSDWEIFYCVDACMQMYFVVFLTLRCENWHNDIFIIKNETKLTANITRETVAYGLVFVCFTPDKIILSQGHYTACIRNKTAVGDVIVCWLMESKKKINKTQTSSEFINMLYMKRPKHLRKLFHFELSCGESILRCKKREWTVILTNCKSTKELFFA